MNKLIYTICIILFTLTLTACGNENPMISAEGAGFFAGIWDGLTCVIAFILSIFGADYNIYEVVNTGNWYNFGFLLGLIGAVATTAILFWCVILIIGVIIAFVRTAFKR